MTASQSMRKGLPDYLLTGQARSAQDFSFTRGASDRNETRVLARFVRLADLLVLNALREVRVHLSSLKRYSLIRAPAASMAANEVLTC